MIFPEELDNRSFHLLVQRIAELQKSEQSLTHIEQEVADLIAQFPELHLGANSEHSDLYRTSAEEALNSYLILSAIWQVSKQIRDDFPKGMAKIIRDHFHKMQLTSDELYRVATIYLSLYEQVRQEGAVLSDKDYLWEVYYALKQDDERQDKVHDQGKSTDASVQPFMVGQAFTEIARQLHDDASYIKLTADATAEEILSQLPIEWINAMSSFWQCSDQRLKRDKIKEVSSFFAAVEFATSLARILSREEKKCLSAILEKGNCIHYSTVARDFGPEHNDGYWWTQDAPKSTLGNLRMKGLVAVGEMTVNGESMRVAMIPSTISRTVAQALSSHA